MIFHLTLTYHAQTTNSTTIATEFYNDISFNPNDHTQTTEFYNDSYRIYNDISFNPNLSHSNDGILQR